MQTALRSPLPPVQKTQLIPPGPIPEANSHRASDPKEADDAGISPMSKVSIAPAEFKGRTPSRRNPSRLIRNDLPNPYHQSWSDQRGSGLITKSRNRPESPIPQWFVIYG